MTMVTESMKEIMVTKIATAQEFFFVTVALEFWKIDRLVAGLGDGCLVVASKTIHRQANLHNKGTHNNKSTPKSSHKFSSPKLQQILAQKPIHLNLMFGGFFFHICQYPSYFVLEVYLLPIRILLLIRIHMMLQIQDTLRQMDYYLCYF
jgi:hypothetical protein